MKPFDMHPVIGMITYTFSHKGVTTFVPDRTKEAAQIVTETSATDAGTSITAPESLVDPGKSSFDDCFFSFAPRGQ